MESSQEPTTNSRSKLFQIPFTLAGLLCSRPQRNSPPSKKPLSINSRSFTLPNPSMEPIVPEKPTLHSLNTLDASQPEFLEDNRDEMVIETTQAAEPEEIHAPEAIQEEIVPEEPRRTEEKCQYCNFDFSVEVIEFHKEECDFRKIFCGNCGELIPLEVFDYHLNECNTDMEDNNEGDESENIEGEDRRNSMEEEGRPTRRRNPAFIPESEMTYERLLQLDENAVKKGMTEEQIKNFKVNLYVKSLDGLGSCVVCMEEYETGGYLRKLSCKHQFHKECIDKWLEDHITCPTCKKELR